MGGRSGWTAGIAVRLLWRMVKAIRKPGTYGAGDYRLAADISCRDQGLVFTGEARLDLNGHSIEGLAAGDQVTVGVDARRRLTLYDGVGGGIIAGFRIGVLAAGARSRVAGITVSSRYLGIWIAGVGSIVDGCRIEDIAGVSDEPYAVGVQVGAAANCTVVRCTVRNVYRQERYRGDAQGEGVAINLTSDAEACAVRECVCINDEPRADTIGVFAGQGGGHVVEDSMMRNFALGLAAVSEAACTFERNFVILEAPIRDSLAISGRAAAARANVVAGPYEASVSARDTAGNLIVGSPPEGDRAPATPLPPRQPLEAGEGPVLAETLDSHFGNIACKTARIEIKAATMTVPPRPPTRTRLMLRATNDEPFAVGGLYVGHKAAGGTAGEAAALHPLTVGGRRSFVIPMGMEAWTDWCDFAWDGQADLVVSLYCDGEHWQDKMAARLDTEHATYLTDGDAAGEPAAEGLASYPGYLSAVGAIETDGFET